MGRTKIDNPLFKKTEDREDSLKDLNSKTLKVSQSNKKSTKAKFNSLKLPKFKTFNEQILVRFSDDQVGFLSRLESSIMKNRTSENKKERITKNTIIRVAVDAIRSINVDFHEISNEETLLARIQSAMKTNKRTQTNKE